MGSAEVGWPGLSETRRAQCAVQGGCALLVCEGGTAGYEAYAPAHPPVTVRAPVIQRWGHALVARSKPRPVPPPPPPRVEEAVVAHRGQVPPSGVRPCPPCVGGCGVACVGCPPPRTSCLRGSGDPLGGCGV